MTLDKRLPICFTLYMNNNTYTITQLSNGSQKEICRITAPNLRAAREAFWISNHPNEAAASDFTGKTLNIVMGGPTYQIRVAR